MYLVLDADATIKLYRAGVLAHVIGAFSCLMPQAVYDEVVVRGKARLHRDAEAIERILAGAVAIVLGREGERPELGLGAGELGVLDVLVENSEGIALSDDRRFLSLLSARRAAFVTPADMLVVLARRGVLTGVEAGEALERLRPLIRLSAYYAARRDLETER